MCFVCIYVCAPHASNAHEGQKVALDPEEEESSRVVLGVKLGFLEDEPVLNHTAISPVNEGSFYLFLHSVYCNLFCW